MKKELFLFLLLFFGCNSPQKETIYTDMILVQGGSFYKTNNNGIGEQIVTISSFYIGRKEVTQELWIDIMGGNPSSNQGNKNWPVESVSYEDIQEFLKKLNERTGLNYRLPTNAEWEFVAKGGVNSHGYWNVKEREDFWKNEKLILPNPNEIGVYNMIEGVSEWVSDKYSEDYYERVNPQGPKVTFWSTKYCYRGKYGESEGTRVYRRTHFGAKDEAYPWLGFRLALSKE